MKEPRFRFWLTKEKKMVYDSPYDHNSFESVDSVPMLYTQLFADSMIYEYDLIAPKHAPSTNRNTYEVVFSKGSFYAQSLHFGEIYTPLLHDLLATQDFKVVGNAYEHSPELTPIIFDDRTELFKNTFRIINQKAEGTT